MAQHVAYIISDELAKVSSLLPSNPGRSILVHSLIKALGLISPARHEVRSPYVLKPRYATTADLQAYHDRDYIDFVLSPPETMSESDKLTFGLEDDCPPFAGLEAYVRLVAGASLTAASALTDPRTDFAICWDGGRHHASKSSAAGFCYVADVILSILSLRRVSPRPYIFYLDLDLHFSDAVSNSFSSISSSQVLTLSIHHQAPGFFPDSPLALLTPSDTSDPFTLSIPLAQGASAKTFARIWAIIQQIKDSYNPDYVIVQCGVDGLAGDPSSVWNWSIDKDVDGSLGFFIEKICQWRTKTLFLGGGGYNSPNAARTWAYLTSIICNNPIAIDLPIPDHRSFPLYAPSFTLDVPAGHMQDKNSPEYLETVENTFAVLISRVQELRSACNDVRSVSTGAT